MSLIWCRPQLVFYVGRKLSCNYSCRQWRYNISTKTKQGQLTHYRVHNQAHSRPESFSSSASPLTQLNLPFWRPLFINQICKTYSNMGENRFSADYARMGTSGCKKCKQKIEKGSFRIAKLVTNPFTDDNKDMKMYHHPRCMFETFLKARATTKIIEDVDDLDGYANLEQADKDLVKELITDTQSKKGTPKKKPAKPAAKKAATPVKTPKKEEAPPPPSAAAATEDELPEPSGDPMKDRDNSFRQFRRLCADIAEENSYIGKTNLVQKYLRRGNSGDGFQGDRYLLLKLLLPGVVKTVYNLNNKQLVKIFSQILGTSLTAMTEDLEQGDVAETVMVFFEQSTRLTPQKKSTLSLQQVDALLTELAKYTKEDDQQTILTRIAKRSTSNDLKMVVRLIKHDLRINAGAKHVLEGLDPNAYEAFQASRDLRDVVDRVTELKKTNAAEGSKPGMSKKLSVRATLMTPVLPMLAEACKSVEQAFKKCPNGMYAEIKYDGERVQVHKKGSEFQYFSRSLKPVLPHKVKHFKDYIPKAFPGGSDLILDCEVLLIDTKTNQPLPFGTLGVHKKQAFKDANVGLFIFDCLHYNGENLMDRPIKERRKILRKNMTEIPDRILFSEMKHITETRDLRNMMAKVFNEGLEGLVLKDVDSMYEPGKRHWLKVKKDYLQEGAMADTADLIVLGAYFGTGNKGGLMSIFLMGVYNPDTDKFCTVTKCGSGFDDKTLDKLQKEFDMVKISKDFTQVPKWLNINRNLVPDFVVKDPKDSVVWEIIGAEFSKSESHTASGISIRFPRCQKMRPDKNWKTATSLPELKVLYKKSKEKTDFDQLLGASSSKKESPAKDKGAAKMDTDENGDSNVVDDSGSNGGDISNGEATKVKTSPKNSPVKRKLDSPVQTTPSKREKKEEKPVCQYGAKCYQTSSSHKEKYHHPSSSTSASPAQSPLKNLKNVFSGMKFIIPDNVEDYKKLKRYVVAYDGEILSDFEEDDGTHKVVQNKEDVTSDKHVTVAWLWECIKKKKLIPAGN